MLLLNKIKTDCDFLYEVDLAKNKINLNTNNWRATQWIRENFPNVSGLVTGSNYAEITGSFVTITKVVESLKQAGFTCQRFKKVMTECDAGVCMDSRSNPESGT